MHIQTITTVLDGRPQTFTIAGTAASAAELVRLLHAAHHRKRRVSRAIRRSTPRSRFRLTAAGRSTIARSRGCISGFLAPSWPRKPISA